jgi:hypothetical protein
MNPESDLERRVQVLEDIESIKRLKAKYWNSVDNKQWEALSECLSDDYQFESPHLGAMEGRSFIVKVLKRAMKDIKTVHQGHNPEIDIDSPASARGRWALNDRVETPDGGFFSGYGHYEDEYVKENGSWKIKKSKYAYVVEQSSPK